MADYWKSLPRKFCDFCKCWITDNKPSVDFHEQGKRHQENVQKKIGELRKKGLKDYEVQKTLDSDFKKMNDAAMKAYAKDVERDPTLATEFNRELESIAAKKAALPPPQPKQAATSRRDSLAIVKVPSRPKAATAVVKSWLEAKTEDGTAYYFNTETGASSWDAPADGFVSLAKQGKSTKVSAQPDYSGIGPAAKPDPYGQWVAVDNSEPEPLDLDLPEQKGDLVEYKVVTATEDRFHFKEKTVASLHDKRDDLDVATDSVFKKRKFNKDSKARNMRRKADDD